jgi:hypothetical protein
MYELFLGAFYDCNTLPIFGEKKIGEIRKHYIQTNTIAKMKTFVLPHTCTIQQFSTFTACLDTL